MHVVVADYTVVSSPLEQTAWPESSVTWTRSNITDVDDTIDNDLPGIALQFDFPWYGNTTRMVYPDPNGGLFMSHTYVPPACDTNIITGVRSCSFGTISITPSNGYYDMLMMCTTDFNPSQPVISTPGLYAGQTALIRYASLPGVFLLRYDNVTLYFADGVDDIDGRRYLYTFQAELYPSGDIIMHYYSYRDPRGVGGSGNNNPRYIIVGIRPPPTVSTTDARPTLNLDWSTVDTGLRSGTYATRAAMNTVPTLRYHPIGTAWCMTPRSSTASGGGTVRVLLRPSAPLERSSFICWFGDQYTVGTAVGGGSVEVLCPIPAVTQMGTNYTLMLPYLTRPSYNCTTSKIVNGTTVASYNALTTQALTLSCTNITNCSIITDCGIHVNTTVVLFRLAVADPDVPSRQRFLPLAPGSLLFAYYPDDLYMTLDPYASLSATQAACQWCGAAAWLADTCSKDCTGVWKGNATIDTCGICSGGNTGIVPNSARDCQGVCFGPWITNTTTGACQCQTMACLNYTLQPATDMGSAAQVQMIWAFDARGANADIAATESLSWNPYSFTDNQLELLVPGFNMPFYTTTLDFLYVSQYGAIVPSNYAFTPCINTDKNGFPGVFTGTFPSSCAVIAVSLSSSLSVASPATVEYAIGTGTASVRWTTMPFRMDTNYTGAARAIYESFQVTLMSSGNLRYTFINVTDPTLVDGYASGRNWMVGVRAGLGTTSILSPFGGVGLEQQWVGNGSAYTREGVYVPRGSVISNSSILFCRMPQYMCISPRYGPATGGNRVRFVGTAITQCFADIPMVCLFGGVVTGVPSIDDYGTMSCVVPPGSPITTVVIQLAVAETLQIIDTGNKLFYSYWPVGDTHVANMSLMYTQTSFCNDCHQLATASYCVVDCAGVYAGTAYYDTCGVCSGGTTSHVADSDKDCRGICFGGFLPRSNGQCVCTVTSPSSCATNPAGYVVNATRSWHYLHSTSSTGSGIPSWVPALSQWTVVDTTTVNGSQPLLTSVVTSFTFYVYGTAYRRLYISSDGSLLVGDPPLSACLRYGATLSFTSHATCNFSVIAAGLTALDMRDAILAYYANETHVVVRWQNARLYIDPLASPVDPRANGIRQSMSITLASDSTIAISLYNITDPTLIGNGGTQYTPRHWLVGVQQQASLATTSFSGTNELGYYPAYNTTTMFNAGEYPSRAEAISGTTTDFCRVSYTTCMSPRSGAASRQTLVKLLMPDNSDCMTTMAPSLSFWFDWGSGTGSMSVRTPAIWNITTSSLDSHTPTGNASTVVVVTVWTTGVVGTGIQLRFMDQPLYYSYTATSSSTSDFVQICGDCAALIPTYCQPDCMGVSGGIAAYDSCGICCGGTSGVTCDQQLDCDGNCYGPMIQMLYNGVEFCGCDATKANTLKCNLYAYLSGPIGVGDTMDPVATYQLTILAILALGGICAILITMGMAIYRHYHDSPNVVAPPPAAAPASAPPAAAPVAVPLSSAPHHQQQHHVTVGMIDGTTPMLAVEDHEQLPAIGDERRL